MNVKHLCLTLALMGLAYTAVPTVAVGSNNSVTYVPTAKKGEKNALEKHLKSKKIKYKTAQDGFYYTVAAAGSDRKPQAGDYVKVHYTGTLLDGTKFDSSLDRNEPIEFQIGKGSVIPGWDKGIALFGKGGKGTLYLPAALAYGERGAGKVIPPNADLIFEVEVLDIKTEQEYQNNRKAEQDQRAAAQKMAAAQQIETDKKLIEDYAKANNLTLKQTPSGLYYLLSKEGTGKQAEAQKTVKVHYTGMLLDGKKFDSSLDRNEPIEFKLGVGQVIKGWDEGIALFREGSKGTLLIPSGMAYGPRAVGGVIPANAVLRFDIELIEVK